ncbi:hypothetical protein [Frisingicoccus sp.]|uniref:hypothetical protein n=1 Tax=Frisingicoccus sp. TaxID=1918627 RepID=UPI0037355CD2
MRTEKDMYLPNWVCVLGVVFLVASIVCVAISFTASRFSMVGCLIGAVICLTLGIAAILCWKNQWVEMENNYEFIYSTMFGRQYHYRFSEIKDLKRSSDSMTLLLENGKVHIESCALISERFADQINGILRNELEW